MASIASNVDVANMALIGLGADPIISFTEASRNAKLVNVIFNLMRDEVLRAHKWNFAITRREFNQVAGFTAVFGFANAFLIPQDIIRVLDNETGNDFAVEEARVMTDDSEFKCTCVVRVEDTTQWDTAFVGAFAARLESELAYPITNSLKLAQQKYDVYLAKLSNAKSQDAQEGTPEPFTADEWINIRFFGGSAGDVAATI